MQYIYHLLWEREGRPSSFLFIAKGVETRLSFADLGTVKELGHR